MPLPSFTISPGGINDVVGDVESGELVETPITGAQFTFKSNVPVNKFVSYGTHLERIKPVVGTVTEDGELLRDGDPVQLLAEDDGLNVTGVQWTVTAVLPDGRRMAPWTFDALADGETVVLSTTAQVVAVPVGGVAQLTLAALLSDLAEDNSTLREALDAVYASDTEWQPYVNLAAFPATGNTTKEYLAQDTGKLYRWNGSAYIQIADKAAVGLGNADNTSDTNKPVSTAQATADAAVLTTATGRAVAFAVALG